MGLNGAVLGQENKSLTDFTTRPHRLSIEGENQTEIGFSNTGGSIASGYRMLMRNTTLAGRSASSYFTGADEQKSSSSRLKMVSRLRKKEKFMIWKSIWYDLTRFFMTSFFRLSPSFVYSSSDIANSAVRFRCK